MKHYTKENWVELLDTTRNKPPTTMVDLHDEVVGMMKRDVHPVDIRLMISDYNYQRIVSKRYSDMERVYIRRLFCFIGRCDKEDVSENKNDFTIAHGVKNVAEVERNSHFFSSAQKITSMGHVSSMWRYITKGKNTKLVV
jgi:hypothetical protein